MSNIRNLYEKQQEACNARASVGKHITLLLGMAMYMYIKALRQLHSVGGGARVTFLSAVTVRRGVVRAVF